MMANPFIGFWTFLIAVVGHSFTLLAGCTATVMLGMIEKFVLKRPISLKSSLAILLAFVFFSCFQAWHDQYQRADVLQKTFNQRPAPPQIQVNVPPSQVIVNVPTQEHVPKATIILQKFEGLYSVSITRNGVTSQARSFIAKGSRAAMNLFFINTGAATADAGDGWGKIYIEPSSVTEGELTNRFKKELKSKPFSSHALIEPGGTAFWFTALSDQVVTQDDVDQLSDGTKRLFIFASESYHDPSGEHYAHHCFILQQPPKTYAQR